MLLNRQHLNVSQPFGLVNSDVVKYIQSLATIKELKKGSSDGLVSNSTKVSQLLDIDVG